MTGGERGAKLRARIDDLERVESVIWGRTPRMGTPDPEPVDVLFFEDSDTDAFVIQQILREHGMRHVARVRDANDWERWVAHFQPRVIMLDVVMPGKNGYAALREIRRHPVWREIPVVMCTSKNTDSDFVWATKRGAAGFVVKPFADPRDLVMTISAAAGNARVGRRLDVVL